MAFASYSGGSSSGVPDPLVPADGTQNVTGGVTASGTIRADDVLAFLTNASAARLQFGDSLSVGEIRGARADAATAVAIRIAAGADLVTDGALIVEFGDDALATFSQKLTIDKEGKLRFVSTAGSVTGANAEIVNQGGGLVINSPVGQSVVLSINGGSRLVVDADGTQLVGGLRVNTVATKTAAYTATDADFLLLGDATLGAFSFTLPTAVGRAGKIFVFKKIDVSGNAVTIDGNALETIDGAITVALAAQWAFRVIQSDGANWVVIGS